MAVVRDKVGGLATSNGAGTRVSTFATNPPAGDKVLVAIWTFTTTAISSVTDNAGNTYTQDASFTGNTGNSSLVVRLYRADNVSLPGSGTLAVSVVMSNDGSCCAVAYSGVASGAPTATNTNQGGTAGSTATSGAAGGTSTGLHVAVLTNDSGSNPTGVATSTPFSQQAAEQDGVNFLSGAVSDQLNAAASSTCTWTMSAAHLWSALIAAYDLADPPTPVRPRPGAFHPGRGPLDAARFYKTPRSTLITTVVPTVLTDPSADSTRLGSAVDTLAADVVLTDTAGGGWHSSTTDTLAIGVTVADPSATGTRAATGTGETIAVGMALADPGAGGQLAGVTTGSVTTEVVLTDQPGQTRAAGSTDTAAIGIVLADRPVGMVAGDVFGETAANAVVLTDPGAGTVAAGSTAGSLTVGVLLTDIPTGTIAGDPSTALVTGVVFADPPAGAGRAGTVGGETITSATTTRRWFHDGSSSSFIVELTAPVFGSAAP